MHTLIASTLGKSKNYVRWRSCLVTKNYTALITGYSVQLGQKEMLAEVKLIPLEVDFNVKCKLEASSSLHLPMRRRSRRAFPWLGWKKLPKQILLKLGVLAGGRKHRGVETAKADPKRSPREAW